MSCLSFTEKSSYSRCMNSAMYSLAMREHSRHELAQKLKKKGFSEGVDIDVLLDELEEKNYLSDERFTESFIRYRSSRGQGSLKITSELNKRGVSSLIIQSAIQNSGINWYDVAAEQRAKKFGSNTPVDYKEKARQMRFLSSRGFPTDIIYSIVES